MDSWFYCLINCTLLFDHIMWYVCLIVKCLKTAHDLVFYLSLHNTNWLLKPDVCYCKELLVINWRNIENGRNTKYLMQEKWKKEWFVSRSFVLASVTNTLTNIHMLNNIFPLLFLLHWYTGVLLWLTICTSTQLLTWESIF